MCQVKPYLSSAESEGEGLAAVPGAVHLGAVGEGQHVVTLHLLPRLGEAGAVPGVHGLDVHTHVEHREAGVHKIELTPARAGLGGRQNKGCGGEIRYSQPHSESKVNVRKFPVKYLGYNFVDLRRTSSPLQHLSQEKGG